MKIRLAFVPVVALALFALLPGAAMAGSTSGSFLLVMEEPNFGRAPTGDHIMITGGGSFSIHPKAVSAGGAFTHFDPAGNPVASGTWTATDLLSFNFYGCRFIPALGVDLGDDNLCGGAVKMRVVLDTPIGPVPGILTVFCIVGPNAPHDHNEPPGEGVTLNVPGIANFNHTDHGMNIYIIT